ncbi:hypothetical protein [Colwellia sp. E2M01]|uniref:hypothetical protein n=1 Tax=Colwellia sp. E2M01 TaxID=2841561 RepID=UPI001C0A1B2B|nr:hypothetical protein [Colwellia sp. E2M01]MBU2869801.1 hypothetical protein [Colwellia sp. E2M01]
MSIQLGSSSSFSLLTNIKSILPIARKSSVLATASRADFSDILTTIQKRIIKQNADEKSIDADFTVSSSLYPETKSFLQQKSVEMYMHNNGAYHSDIRPVERNDINRMDKRSDISPLTAKQLDTFNSLMTPRNNSYLHLSA